MTGNARICNIHGVDDRDKSGKCRHCRREYGKQYRGENDPNRRIWHLAVNHFGPNCAYCGQSNRHLLELHHPNNDGAEKRRELMGRRTDTSKYIARLYRLGWPEDHKLEVACLYCHGELTRFGEVTWFKQVEPEWIQRITTGT